MFSRILSWLATSRRRPWQIHQDEPPQDQPPSVSSRERARLAGLDRSIAYIAVSKATTAEDRLATVDRLMQQGIPYSVIEDALDDCPLVEPAERCALKLWREFEQGEVA